MTDEQKILLTEEQAVRVAEWLTTRGGVLRWESLNLSDPGRVWTTPAHDEGGKPSLPPHWAAGRPTLYMGRNRFEVGTFRVFKVVRIALRLGAQGFMIKLTDASSRKVRRALEDAGPDSYFEFGGWDGRDCTIYQLTGKRPLAEFMVNREVA